MTGFDGLILLIFAVSIGFAAMRGAIRELGTLAALLFGVLAAWIFTGAILSGLGKDDFISTVVVAGALVAIGFAVSHIGITIFSGRIRLTERQALYDRIGGGVFGLLRAFALIGLGFIGYSYYLDADSRPDGVKNAAFLPLATGAANVMRGFTPGDPLAEADAPQQPDAAREIDAGDRRALDEIVTTVTTDEGGPARAGADDIADLLKEETRDAARGDGQR